MLKVLTILIELQLCLLSYAIARESYQLIPAILEKSVHLNPCNNGYGNTGNGKVGSDNNVITATEKMATRKNGYGNCGIRKKRQQ